MDSATSVVPARFAGQVTRTGDCWTWTGTLRDDGYGKFSGRQAHRVVYEHMVGPIAAGLELDHLCRNKACVNPTHLDPVSRLENIRRRYSTYTHCKWGHEFTLDNTYTMPNGRRACRRCRTAASDRYRARRKARKS
jgi:hypothetical protein